jgi:signal transduction histidine kinase
MHRDTEDRPTPGLTDDPVSLRQQLKDYAQVGINLFWQRQAIFGSALVLEAYYFSYVMALVTLGLIVVSEVYDHITFQQILRQDAQTSERKLRLSLIKVQIGTCLSAGIIAFYALSISYLQGPTTHFMPLFFLFAAALFAAMNNHQIFSLIVMRLLIYGVTFLFIPLWDIVQTQAPLHSDLWAQLFTSVFVVYFIIDCSRIYMNLYRSNRQQLKALQIEHEITKEALKSKSEFLATVSHELRTPLTSVKGSLDLACAGALGPMPEKLQSTLGIAQRNTTRLHALINELLDLQRMDAGKMSFDFAPVDLGALIQRSLDAMEPYAERFGVQYEQTPLPEPLEVWADAGRLEQVLGNILSNAAKFSPEGGTVTLSVEADAERLRINISDTGIGLTEADREKVFDRFSQVDSSDQRKAGGTGLGMNIAKRIVAAHGGTIDYRPNPDQGTTFFVELARHHPDHKPMPQALAG